MDVKNKLKEIWGSIKPWQKYTSFAVLLIVITIASFTLSKPDGYDTLYSSLSDNDKNSILTELQKMGVEFQVIEASGTIEVKSEDVNWVRNEMTTLGLPSNASYNYENFFNTSLGTTKKEKELQELASRKGQLEQDILRNFSSIEKVSVQLKLPPEDSVFNIKEGEGSASVTITQKKGNLLSEQQIAGLQNMVATSIPGVEAEEVQINDAERGPISQEKGSTQYNASTLEKQLAIQKESEKDVQNDIQNSLVQFFGHDNIGVTVNMSINFDEVVQNIERYGEKGVVRSKQTEKETSVKGSNAADIIEAGIEDNGDVIEYENIEGEETPEYAQNIEKNIENYEIDKTIETIKKNPQLTNTNVVVWIDRTKMREKGIDEDAFRNAIAIAAGLTVNENGTYQNGQVSVMSIDKEQTPAVEEVETTPSFVDTLKENLLWVIIGAVVVIAILIVLLLVFLKKKKAQAEEDEEELSELTEEAQQQLKLLNRELSSDEDENSEYDAEILSTLKKNKDEMYKEREKEIMSMMDKEKQAKKQKQMEELDAQVEKLATEYPRETADFIKRLLR